MNSLLARWPKVLAWFLDLSFGMRLTLCFGVFGIVFVSICIFLWMADKKLKARAAEKAAEKEKPKDEGAGTSKEKWFKLTIPLLAMLYLFVVWAKFDGAFMQFMLTQKFLGGMFGIAIITYLILMEQDWKAYLKFGRSVSGWVTVVILGFIVLIYAGNRWSWARIDGIVPERAPIATSSNGEIVVIYRPGRVVKDINLPAGKYNIRIKSSLKWKEFNHKTGKIQIFSVGRNGLPWTPRRLGKKVRLSEYPFPDANVGGVVIKMSGSKAILLDNKNIANKAWVKHNGYLVVQGEGGKIKEVCLNAKQTEPDLSKFWGEMEIKFVPL